MEETRDEEKLEEEEKRQEHENGISGRVKKQQAMKGGEMKDAIWNENWQTQLVG